MIGSIQQKQSKSIWLVEHELGAPTDGTTEVLHEFRSSHHPSAGTRINEALGRYPMLTVLGGVVLGFVAGRAALGRAPAASS